MEAEESGGGGGTHWWWALASAAQLGCGIWSFRKGYAGDSCLMPIKAFGVASLFVGSAASASAAFLQASGIHKVSYLFFFSHTFYFPSIYSDFVFIHII